MQLNSVTVEIDYRFDAGQCRSCNGTGWHGRCGCPRCQGTGSEPPSSRALIARVRTPVGDGFNHGPCLIGPKIVLNTDKAKSLARLALNGKAAAIQFIVSDRVAFGRVR